MQSTDPTLFKWCGIIDDQGCIRPVGKKNDHHQPARHNNGPFSADANQSRSERVSIFYLPCQATYLSGSQLVHPHLGGTVAQNKYSAKDK